MYTYVCIIFKYKVTIIVFEWVERWRGCWCGRGGSSASSQFLLMLLCCRIQWQQRQRLQFIFNHFLLLLLSLLSVVAAEVGCDSICCLLLLATVDSWPPPPLLLLDAGHNSIPWGCCCCCVSLLCRCCHSRMIDPPRAATIPLPVHIESVEFHGLLLLILAVCGGTVRIAVWAGRKISTNTIVVFLCTIRHELNGNGIFILWDEAL